MFRIWPLALLFSTLVLLLWRHTSLAVEITATDEWQLLGENDTVDAGLHIRMDLTTGEKWVKLPDSKDDHDTKSAAAAVVVTANGQAESVTRDLDKQGDEPAYDFDMMHRTLSKLPEKDQERIGLPEAPSKNYTPEQRELFQARMKEIWTARQEELRRWERDMLADLPQILKDRIRRIKDYLEDPVSELASMDLSADTEQDRVTHIVSVLRDLEYQLADIDMTRDFYTLGGWPVLVSLVTTSAHQPGNLTDESRAKIPAVQTAAAWAVGTAVKNSGEFAPFCIEPLIIGEAQTTAVDVLLEELRDDDLEDATLHKLLYAIGSCLRANRPVQSHFAVAGGPKVLGELLSSAVEHVASQPLALKLSMRLLALADDIAMDIQLHGSPSPQVDQAIAQAFATEEWCQAILRAVTIESPAQETALKAVRALAPLCQWDQERIQESLGALKSSWEGTADGEIDPDVQRDRLALVDAVHKAVAAS